MTPQEKAKELVEKYWHEVTYENEEYEPNVEAIKCAIIAVDEVAEHVLSEHWNYWQEVRKAIKLI